MINAIIKNRRAVRKFTADSVSADEIKNLPGFKIEVQH